MSPNVEMITTCKAFFARENKANELVSIEVSINFFYVLLCECKIQKYVIEDQYMQEPRWFTFNTDYGSIKVIRADE